VQGRQPKHRLLDQQPQIKPTTMAPSSCSNRHLSSTTNLPDPQAHPKDLCGTWTYEYKSPYCPYGNQHIQETYTLLSCGFAYHSLIDKYDEGKDYFSEHRTSGWGRWFVKTNQELIIHCNTVTASSVGGAVCGDEEPLWKDSEYSSSSQLRESLATFISKYTRQRSLDDIEEDNFRTQMNDTLENLPPKAEPELEEQFTSPSLLLQETSQCRSRCANKSSSRTVQKPGALSGLRQMLCRSKRQCS